MSWKRLMKENVHQITTHTTRRLDENEALRSHPSGYPCSDTVARHRPCVRKRIGLDQPSRWRQHRHTPCAQHPSDFGWLGDERSTGQPGRNDVGKLVHGQYRHPVCRIIGETKPAIDFAHSVGERSAPRNNQQPASPGTAADRSQCGIELSRVPEDSAPELDYDLDNASIGDSSPRNQGPVSASRTVFVLSARHYRRPSRPTRTVPAIQATRLQSGAGSTRACMDTSLCE